MNHKSTLREANELAQSVEEMGDRLANLYKQWVEVVQTNGLTQGAGGDFQHTFMVTRFDAYWSPDPTDEDDIVFKDGDDTFFMPKAWLEDPEAWLAGALAAHGQAVADHAAERFSWSADVSIWIRYPFSH